MRCRSTASPLLCSLANAGPSLRIVRLRRYRHAPCIGFLTATTSVTSFPPAYARRIDRSLATAMVMGDDSYFTPKLECPGRNHDDDGFPDDSIVESYEDYINTDKSPVDIKVADPLPEYTVDRSVACQTGSEVPWTGVWYPGTGLENQSLTFAIKGLRMQPAFRIVKTVEKSEAEGRLLPRPQTIALITTWHPVIPLVRWEEPQGELRAQAAPPVPRQVSGNRSTSALSSVAMQPARRWRTSVRPTVSPYGSGYPTDRASGTNAGCPVYATVNVFIAKGKP